MGVALHVNSAHNVYQIRSRFKEIKFLISERQRLSHARPRRRRLEATPVAPTCIRHGEGRGGSVPAAQPAMSGAGGESAGRQVRRQQAPTARRLGTGVADSALVAAGCVSHTLLMPFAKAAQHSETKDIFFMDVDMLLHAAMPNSRKYTQRMSNTESIT